MKKKPSPKADKKPVATPPLVSPQQCWELLLRASRELASFCEEEPGAVDYERLYTVLNKCQNMLANSAALGDERAASALAQHTAYGCEILRELATLETSKQAIGKVAIDRESWPVALPPGDKASKAAQKYLTELGVGTKGVMPTASKIQTNDVWASLVISELEKIRGGRIYLFNKRSTVPEWSKVDDLFKPIAERWETELRSLPPRLNSETWEAHWHLVEKMIRADWTDSPQKKNSLLDTVSMRRSAEASNRSPEEYVFWMAEKKLKKIAAKVNHADDYFFLSSPPDSRI